MTERLRDLLVEPDPAAVQRTWRSIRDRRAAPRRGHIVVALACAAASAVVVGLVVRAQRPDQGLTLVDGTSLTTALATDASRDLVLDDGSHLRIDRDTRIAITDNTSDRTRLVLDRGRARFIIMSIFRRWTVHSDSVTVDTDSAVFTIARSDNAVDIAVAAGEVRVASAQLSPPDRILASGQSISVPIVRMAMSSSGESSPGTSSSAPSLATPSSSGASSPETSSMPPSSSHPSSSPPRASPPVTTAPLRGSAAGEPVRIDATPQTRTRIEEPKAATWRELAGRGDYRAAFAVLGVDGIGREATTATSIDELVMLADIARLSNHANAAVAPLRRASSLDGAGAAVAGYSLGRLLLDQLRDPRGAAAAIEGAVARGLPVSLDEPARARLVEAYASAGDRDAAGRAAATYLARYPRGRSVEAVRAWGGSK